MLTMVKLLFILIIVLLSNILLVFTDSYLLDSGNKFSKSKSQALDASSPVFDHNTATNFSLALKKYLDDEFYGSIGVGSRNQRMQVIFDTAWRTSWLLSKSCAPSVSGCTGHNQYDHDRSATYIRNGTEYTANEGEYVLKGFYSTDKMNFGGVSKVNMTFVEMTDVPPSYHDMKADGVIGLAPSYNGEITLPEKLFNQNNITKPIFSIYLNRDYQSNRGGVITLGEINAKHIHKTDNVPDEITYVRVDDSLGQWAFKMDGVSLNVAGHTVPLCVNDCKAFVSTGGINIYAPQDAVKEINYRINAQPDDGKYAIDCDKILKLPPFNVIIGGKTFTLKGVDYTHKVTVRNVQKCYSVFMETQTPSETGWVLGASFLARYFSIYNFQSRVIGFVRAA